MRVADLERLYDYNYWATLRAISTTSSTSAASAVPREPVRLLHRAVHDPTR